MLFTQRIFWPSYNTEEKLAHLLAFLQNHRALCDEISFFTEGDGLDWRYLPRDEVSARAAYLKQAIATARAAGFATAVNVLNTMGHSDEGGASAPDLPWQGITGHDGAVSRKCSCPFDADFLAYTTFKYEAFATTGAGKYWIDDDVRLNNHAPAAWGCFCEKCLADFAVRIGRPFGREELISALGDDPALRRQWVERNDVVLQNVLDACAAGVRRAEPEAEIGFMCCDITDLHDCGVDWTRWFEKLALPAGGRSWLRPGGGFWSDATPRGVLTKVHAVGNSIDPLPAGVLATYEVENYPFIQGEKSASQTGLECLLVTAATRLDGIMFDILDPAGNALEPFAEWAGDLAAWRPLWEQAAELVDGTTPVGWRPAYSLHHFQQHRSTDLNAMRHISYQEPLALQTAGLPLTAFSAGARGHLLCGSAARGMSDAELQALLQKPLMLDGPAAQVFLDAGLGAEIGIQSIEEQTEGVYEEFSAHPLNGAAHGYKRSMTLSYFGVRSYALEAAPEAQILSTLYQTGGRELGAALTLRQGPAGAPVAVLGHMPYRFVTSPQRMEQLQNLSQAMLGLRHLTGTRPVAVWWREGEGKTLAVLFNAGFDEARHIVVPAGGRLALSTPGVNLRDEALHLPGWGVAIIQFS